MKLQMKKKLCVFLSLLTLMLTGCGKADEAADTSGNTEVYSGDGYKLSYDPDKWEWSVETDYKGEEYVAFNRKDHDDVSFEIQRKFDNSGVTLNDFLEQSKKMGELDGIDWSGGETLSINGWNWGRAELQQSYSNHNIYFVWLFTVKSSYSYRIDFSSESPSYYDCLPEFDEIIDTFEFT